MAKNFIKSGYEFFSNKEIEKIMQEQQKHKVTCECGTKEILVNVDKKICRGCHNYVFKDKKTEFEYRLKEKMFK